MGSSVCGGGRGRQALALFLAACLCGVALAQPQATPDAATAGGCVLVQAQGFRQFSMRWGYFRLQGGFVRKEEGWAQTGAEALTVWQTTDGYWYMGKNPPFGPKTLTDMKFVMAYSAAEAKGPAQPNATLIIPPALPPSTGWVVVKPDGETPETIAEFTCACRGDIRDCSAGGESGVNIFAATSVGVCGWICCLGCALVGYRRWLRTKLGEAHPSSLNFDIEQGQSDSSPFESRSTAARPPQPVKITPKERAQHALSIISSADEGLLWVGYSKPGGSGRPNEEKFAALKWIKTLEMEPPKERTDPDDTEGLCCVCLDNPAACKLMPCEHAQFCAPCIVENACRWCARQAPECPVCRTAFTTIMLPPAPKRDPKGEGSEQPVAPAPANAVLSSQSDTPLMTSSAQHHPGSQGGGPPLGFSVPLGGADAAGRSVDGSGRGVAYSLAPAAPQRSDSGNSGGPQEEVSRLLFPTTPNADNSVVGDIVLFNSDALEALTASPGSSLSPGSSADTSAHGFGPTVPRPGHGTTTQGIVVPLSVPLTVVTPSAANVGERASQGVPPFRPLSSSASFSGSADAAVAL